MRTDPADTEIQSRGNIIVPTSNVNENFTIFIYFSQPEIDLDILAVINDNKQVDAFVHLILERI